MNGLTKRQERFIDGMNTVLEAIEAEKTEYAPCGCEGIRERIESEIALEVLDRLVDSVSDLVCDHTEYFKESNALTIINNGMSRKAASKRYGKEFANEVLGGE